jgi:predicted porin
MFKPSLGLALSMGAMVCAHADTTVTLHSDVTLYGVLDQALCYQTHTNANGNSNFTMQASNEGFLSGNRLGVKGNLALDDGWSAGMVLENGFLGNSGKLDQQSQLFGRQAYAKLVHRTYGEIAAGRQYTVANALIYYVDPLGVGAAATNSWQVFMTGQRFDNCVTYTFTRDTLQAMGQYATGGVAGAPKARTSMAVGLKYVTGPVTLIAVGQQTNDSLTRHGRIVLAGARWKLGRTELFAHFLHSDREAGFDTSAVGTDTASITSMTSGAATSAVAINSVFTRHRSDNFATLGVTYRPAAKWLLSAACMYDGTRANGFSGSRQTAYGVADYTLGKYADVYLATAYERTTGGWSGLFGNTTTNANWNSGAALSGRSTQATEMVGFRLKF